EGDGHSGANKVRMRGALAAVGPGTISDAPSGVGPPRAGPLGLRAHIEKTDARNAPSDAARDESPPARYTGQHERCHAHSVRHRARRSVRCGATAAVGLQRVAPTCRPETRAREAGADETMRCRSERNDALSVRTEDAAGNVERTPHLSTR